jgi:hypothetical protein
MRLSILARSLSLSAILLGLVACEAGGPPRRLDDASVPLMTPGYGLVATTLIQSYRLDSNDQPVAVGTSGVTIAHYAPVSGSDGAAFVVQNGGRTRASIVYPAGRAGRGYLGFLTPVKPGKYQLRQLQVGTQDNLQSVFPKNAPVFEVAEGQVTYAGSMRMQTRVAPGRRAGGYETVRRSVEVVDEYTQELPAIQAKEPRLSTVTVKNGLAR